MVDLFVKHEYKNVKLCANLLRVRAGV